MLSLNASREFITSTSKLKNLHLVAVRLLSCSATLNKDVSLGKICQSRPLPGKMIAWQMGSYGQEDVLAMSTLHPEPIVRKPGDIKVEVLASSVNPIDTAMMGGYGATLLNTIHQVESCCSEARNFPIILGRDFVGRVEAIGHGVSHVKVGDEIWGVVAPWAQGAHAQKVIVPARHVRRKPPNLSTTEMAALPYVSVTAWSALKITGEMCLAGRGQRVLILGGAGGVGSVAAQMAKAWDAYVVATCSTDAIPLVESLGAHAVDYTHPGFMREIREHGHFDIVLDAAGVGPNAGQYADVVKHWNNAKYVTLSSPLLRNIDQYGLAFGMLRNLSALVESNLDSGLVKKGASSRWGFFIPTSACLDEIQKLATSGQLTPIVQQVFPFKSIPDAFRRLKEGHLRGKIVIDTSS